MDLVGGNVRTSGINIVAGARRCGQGATVSYQGDTYNNLRGFVDKTGLLCYSAWPQPNQWAVGLSGARKL